jgi:hypothetical protein
MHGTSIITYINELDVFLPNFGVGSYIVNMFVALSHDQIVKDQLVV